jgi:hypothetical protein
LEIAGTCVRRDDRKKGDLFTKLAFPIPAKRIMVPDGFSPQGEAKIHQYQRLKGDLSLWRAV